MYIQGKHFHFRNFIITSLTLFILLVSFPSDSAVQIKLAWDPSITPDVAGYRVYYGIASGAYGTPIDVGNVTTCTLDGLTQGVTYYMAVTAYDTTHYESDYSNEVSGKMTETVSTPNVVSGPTSGITGTSYSFTTGGSSSSLGHSVEYQFDWKGDGTDLSSWGPATQSKNWAAPGTYHVTSRARCAIDTSVVSNWIGSLSVAMNASTVSCTLTTNPSGLQITVDGSTYTAPQSFIWVAGSSHTISVPSPQPGGLGVRYAYASWSDGGAQSHAVTVPSFSITYTANLITQYALATSVNPAGTGTVSPSGTSWYNSGQSASSSAKANFGCVFSSWSGDLSSSTNPSLVLMNSPKNVIANFTQKVRKRK
jgi:hypothetical protein